MTEDFAQTFSTTEPQPIDPHNPPTYNPVHIATREQAKPLVKLLKRMLQPRHPKSRRWTKAPKVRKRKSEQYF